MISLEDILIEQAKEEEKYFKNYLHFAKVIKKEVEKAVGKTRGYIFGSILKKKEVPRDIDLLFISPKFSDSKMKRKTKLKIFEKLGWLCPFEVHLVTPEDYKDWYRYFIKKKKLIK